MKIILPKRTEPQKRIQESKARFKIGGWGRQSGKTTNGIWTMLKKPMEGRRGGVYWHILQTHAAAEIAFKRYLMAFDNVSKKYLWSRSPNNGSKTVFLTGGREVHFKSGQNYEDLRAETLDGAIIDECRQQKKELWTMVVRPMLGRYKGWCDFYSTPHGFDWFYDLTEEQKKNPEWAYFHAPSWEAWWWTPEEVESARRSMSEPEFAQEIGAEFRHFATGLAYYNFGDENIDPINPFSGSEDYSPYLPIGIAMDFNVNPMSWTLGQFKTDEFYWREECVLPNSNTPETIEALIPKIKHHPAGVEIIGDVSGNARSSTATTTDYDIIASVLRRENIKFTVGTPTKNPTVKDRVNMMNVTFKNGHGEVKMKVHPDCKKLIRDFRRVVLKESTSDIFALDKHDPELTHSSDGVGYFVFEKVGRQFDVRPATIAVMWR